MKDSKYILIGIVFIFLISLFLIIGGYESTMDIAYGDINGDGADERIVLKKPMFSQYGRSILIYKKSDREMKNKGPEDNRKKSGEYIEIFREDFSNLKPWKVDSGDVDGDGRYEISIGVFKETIFHPVMAKRPFIYSYNDGMLVPKWRGSRLSRPFTEFTFYDIDKDGRDELMAIEELQDGSKVINSYKWRYFGFEGYSESEAVDNLFKLESDKELTVIREKEKSRIVLSEGSLILERIE